MQLSIEIIQKIYDYLLMTHKYIAHFANRSLYSIFKYTSKNKIILLLNFLHEGFEMHGINLENFIRKHQIHIRLISNDLMFKKYVEIYQHENDEKIKNYTYGVVHIFVNKKTIYKVNLYLDKTSVFYKTMTKIIENQN